jgi:N-acetylglucosamine kinase-like BadF-type ATPase
MGTHAYILGVDGGNTKTIALIARSDGTVVGVGRAGCSDIYTNPEADIPLAELESAVAQAYARAGLAVGSVGVGGFSLAGADWPEDYTFLETAMLQRGLARRAVVVNDAVGALWAGAPSGAAVGVACGTGAAIAARSPAGRVWHTSWWQEPQGAHQLGVRALRAVYRADLGIGPPTTLTAAVLRHPEPVLPAALIARVLEVAPAATPLYSPFEPVVGALFLALDAAQIPLDDVLLARLRATLPESTVFAT